MEVSVSIDLLERTALEQKPAKTADPEKRGVYLELAYHGLLRRVLQILAAEGIPVMPLKGTLLAHWVYDVPAERLGGDIDLLVPAGRFKAALEALARASFTPLRQTDPRECTLMPPGLPIEIDLHRSLFGRGRYRLRMADLFARGTVDRELFSAPVLLPDPYDAWAHVIGHAASEHTPGHLARNERDLERLADVFSMDPRRCASRLEEAGLSRAARYALGLLSPEARFSREVLNRLTPDPLGARLAAIARALALRWSPTSLPSRIAGHLTSASLPAAGMAILLAFANRLRIGLGGPPMEVPDPGSRRSTVSSAPRGGYGV
jgi:hypothetical protein